MAQDLPSSSADLPISEIEHGEDRTIGRVWNATRYIALLTAWVATGGSLFFSEVLRWIPCTLCWYQRILMYPISIILAVGLLRRERGIHWHVLPFSLLGIAMSLYHYLLQKTDWFPPPPCFGSVPCTVDYINLFGFITVPFLALMAFLIISVMMIGSAMLNSAEADMQPADHAAPAGWLAPDRIGVFVIIAIVIIGYIIIA